MSRVPVAAATIILLMLARAGGAAPQRNRDDGVFSNVPHTIAGRVLDPAGGPLQGVLVVAMHPVTHGGVTRIVPLDRPNRVTTNYRGEFRILTVFRGAHYLVAFPRIAAEPGAPLERASYGITYYPRAGSATDAKPLLIGANSRTFATITMVPAAHFVVSGVVIGSDRKPVRGGVLLVAHGGNGLFGLDTRVLTIAPDGTFKTPGLPPGAYWLQFREGVWPVPRDEVPKASSTMVTIAGADMSGIRVAPLPMIRVTGRVVVDAAARATLPSATIQVGASPVNFDGNPGPQRPGVVKADLRIDFRTWPGVVKFRVLLLAQGWKVETIRLNGADVTERDVELRHDTAGLEVSIVKVGGK